MKTRMLAGRKVFSVGLGVMAVDEYFPKPSEMDAIGLIRHAVQQGIEVLDTADVYGMGHNEELLGKALTPQEKNKVIIATKVGCTRPGRVGWGTDGRPEHIREGIYQSLERLGMKQVFLYQLHAPDPNVPLAESMRALKELQEEGLIKHIGVCNVDLDQLKMAQEVVDIVSVQNHFNLAHKNDELDLLPYLTKEKIAYLPYFPLGSGRLIQDIRLNVIAKTIEHTPSQIALAWILQKWPTAIPIPGTRKKEHLDENKKAAEISLSKRTMEELDNLF